MKKLLVYVGLLLCTQSVFAARPAEPARAVDMYDPMHDPLKPEEMKPGERSLADLTPEEVNRLTPEQRALLGRGGTIHSGDSGLGDEVGPNFGEDDFVFVDHPNDPALPAVDGSVPHQTVPAEVTVVPGQTVDGGGNAVVVPAKNINMLLSESDAVVKAFDAYVKSGKDFTDFDAAKQYTNQLDYQINALQEFLRSNVGLKSERQQASILVIKFKEFKDTILTQQLPKIYPELKRAKDTFMFAFMSKSPQEVDNAWKVFNRGMTDAESAIKKQYAGNFFGFGKDAVRLDFATEVADELFANTKDEVYDFSFNQTRSWGEQYENGSLSLQDYQAKTRDLLDKVTASGLNKTLTGSDPNYQKLIKLIDEYTQADGETTEEEWPDSDSNADEDEVFLKDIQNAFDTYEKTVTPEADITAKMDAIQDMWQAGDGIHANWDMLLQDDPQAMKRYLQRMQQDVQSLLVSSEVTQDDKLYLLPLENFIRLGLEQANFALRPPVAPKPKPVVPVVSDPVAPTAVSSGSSPSSITQSDNPEIVIAMGKKNKQDQLNTLIQIARRAISENDGGTLLDLMDVADKFQIDPNQRLQQRLLNTLNGVLGQ